MKIRNAKTRDKWRKAAKDSVDPEAGEALLRSAEIWAERMEELLAKGQSIGSAAVQTSPRIDPIKLHSYWCDHMVNYLEDCWGHGKELRRWYNGK